MCVYACVYACVYGVTVQWQFTNRTGQVYGVCAHVCVVCVRT